MTSSEHGVLDERLTESMAMAGFWDAAPSWGAGVARRVVEGRLVIWSGRGQLLALSALTSVVAGFFDGQVTLGELAEDLADAAEVELGEARVVVASTAIELLGWGVVDDVLAAEDAPVEVAPAPHVGTHEEMRIDPETGAEMRVVVEVQADGGSVTTEHLPDGRRRVTSEMVFGGDDEGDAADAAESLAAQLMDGRRSVAELVPPGSCLGSKLRDGDDVALLSIRCHDEVVRSVRCHEPVVAELLERRAGDRLVPAPERGPVEAFVVTPLEGEGPLRIYDGRGHRRDRPRTPEQAVDVIDQLLGEAASRQATTVGAGVPLSVVLVHTASVGVLVNRGDLERPGVIHRLRSAGWTPTCAAAEAHAQGQIAVPSMHGHGARLTEGQTVLGGEVDGVDPAELVVGLAGALPPGEDGAVALDRLVELASRLGAPDGRLGAEAEAIRRLVEAG